MKDAENQSRSSTRKKGDEHDCGCSRGLTLAVCKLTLMF